jgi:N-ethylmaleimide reductase
LRLGDLQLRNRVVMAPMTRSRADNAALAPTGLHREYYRQRAGAGLIVSEGTWVSPDAIGSANVPGIYSDEQVDAWADVTSAVHSAGGVIFVQIGHTGAYSHPGYRAGRTPGGPSAVSVGGHIFTQGGFVDMPTPRALTTTEIDRIIEDYRAAAVNARRANFDGVEVHAHRWYLLAQFLSPRLNIRTDGYGGSVKNRARLLFEVLDAVIGGWGPGRVGIKLAPYLNALDGSEVTEEMWPAYQYVLPRLADLPLAYLHLMVPQSNSINAAATVERRDALSLVRNLYPHLMDRQWGLRPAQRQRRDRHRRLADGDHATFYQGGASGYVDYPTADSDHTTVLDGAP